MIELLFLTEQLNPLKDLLALNLFFGQCFLYCFAVHPVWRVNTQGCVTLGMFDTSVCTAAGFLHSEFDLINPSRLWNLHSVQSVPIQLRFDSVAIFYDHARASKNACCFWC